MRHDLDVWPTEYDHRTPSQFVAYMRANPNGRAWLDNRSQLYRHLRRTASIIPLRHNGYLVTVCDAR